MAASGSIQPTHLLRESSNTDAAQYVSGSATPTDGRVVTIGFVSRSSAQPTDIVAVTGTGGFNVTWTKVTTIGLGTNIRLTVFVGVATSGGAGALTFDTPSETQTMACWWVQEWTNVNTSTPVITSNNKTATNQTTTTSFSVTCDNALTSAMNAIVGFIGLAANTDVTGGTAQSGQSTGTSVKATDGLTLLFGWGGALTINGTYASSGVNKVGIAIELNHDGTGLSGGGGGVSRGLGVGLAA